MEPPSGCNDHDPSHPSSSSVCKSADVGQATVCPLKCHYRYDDTERKDINFSICSSNPFFPYKAQVIVPMYWLISIYCEHCFDFNCINIILGCAHVCSPTVHCLLCDSFVEIWINRGGHRGGVLHLPQSNIGSAVSAQNDLLNNSKKVRGKNWEKSVNFLPITHLRPRVPRCNSNWGQDSRTETCSALLPEARVKIHINYNITQPAFCHFSSTSWCPLTHSRPVSAGHTSPRYSARFHKRRPVARCAHSRSTPSPWGPGVLWSCHRIFQPVEKQQIKSPGSEYPSVFGTLTYFVIKRNQCHPSPRRLLQQGR